MYVLVSKLQLFAVWQEQQVGTPVCTYLEVKLSHDRLAYSRGHEYVNALYCPSEAKIFNPLNAELNPICYLLVLLAHHFLHVSRIRVKSLTLRVLMSYIYGAPILDVSRSHTQRRTTVGRTPLDE